LPYRDDFIVDNDDNDANNSAQSDLVRIVLNLAFIRKEELEKIDFSADGLQNLAGTEEEMEEAQR
jgi:hypothetical protein